jgi:hypothetical protein
MFVSFDRGAGLCRQQTFGVLLTDFVDQQLEVVNVFKTAVHAGKSNVCHFVELFQLSHHQLA